MPRKITLGLNVPTNISRKEVPRRRYTLNGKRRLLKTDTSVGWQIRVCRARANFRFTKFFADGKYGGTKKALAAAKRYLKAYQHSVPVSSWPVRYHIKLMRRARHSTGIPGVQLAWRYPRNEARNELNAIVFWRDEAGNHQQKFYIGTRNTLTIKCIVAKVNEARQLRIKMIRELDATAKITRTDFPCFDADKARHFLAYGFVRHESNGG